MNVRTGLALALAAVLSAALSACTSDGGTRADGTAGAPTLPPSASGTASPVPTGPTTGSSAGPSGTVSAAASPGAAGPLFDVSAHIPAGVRVYSGGSFFVTAGRDGIATHTADGREVARSTGGVRDGSCILAAVGSDADSGLLIWGETVHTPAAGIVPESWSLSIVATDTKTYTQRWTKPLVTASPRQAVCAEPDAATVTADRRWLAFDTWVVNLADGSSRAYGDGVRPKAIGNTVAVFFQDACLNCVLQMTALPFTDPATGKELFRVADQGVMVALYTRGDYAVSADGATLYAATSHYVPTRDNEYSVQSRSLRTGKITWEKTGTSRSGDAPNVVLAESAGVVVVPDLAPPTAGGPQDWRILGLSTTDGAQLWSLPNAWPCAANGAAVTVVANSQLAALDPRTARQLGYTATRSFCATMVGDYGIYADPGVVVRLLPPGS